MSGAMFHVCEIQPIDGVWKEEATCKEKENQKPFKVIGWTVCLSHSTNHIILTDEPADNY